jgi:hypothetical protein
MIQFPLKGLTEQETPQIIERPFQILGKCHFYYLEQEVAFENYYTSLTANQSALLRATAKEQCVKTPMACSFIMKYRLPALSSIKTALKALVERQLVYQYQGHYIVYDRFFGI